MARKPPAAERSAAGNAAGSLSSGALREVAAAGAVADTKAIPGDGVAVAGEDGIVLEETVEVEVAVNLVGAAFGRVVCGIMISFFPYV
ncbi:hypothetical protein SD70_16730 [Gordoniibacillus kamchatkensis]|uniref:Uncharacterized protein n=1 Tax=Gordoniibacillus kamchatkensis TaxID=1590651 RepID=A0ABR5AG47_9BACL|nr:hypothetical protein SD70_16730 [Paenibacillus sp. VKM B-2647]